MTHFISNAKWNEREVLDLVVSEADKQLGGEPESCLIIDESGFPKKGKSSVGVSRQWCGQLGKVDNCQVGVFAALSYKKHVTLVDERLFLPERWIEDPDQSVSAGVPPEAIVAKSKHDLALEMVQHARNIGLRFQWVSCDGFYGESPQFLRTLEALGEIFMADVHKDQRIYLEDPQPFLPTPQSSGRGRKPTRLQTLSLVQRVDDWVAQQPESAWQRKTLRDTTKGEFQVELFHQLVWN